MQCTTGQSIFPQLSSTIDKIVRKQSNVFDGDATLNGKDGCLFFQIVSYLDNN